MSEFKRYLKMADLKEFSKAIYLMAIGRLFQSLAVRNWNVL